MTAAQWKLVVAAERRLRSAAGSSASALRAHGLLGSLVMLHMLIAVAVSAYLSRPYHPMLGSEVLFLLTMMIPLTLLVLLVWRFFYMTIIARPQSPWRWLLADISGCLLNAERLRNGVTGLLLVLSLMISFSFIKGVGPQVHDFSWDRAFAQLDRWMHLGSHPWELLQPALGHPLLTTAINFVYHLWFFVMFFLVIVAAFSVGDRYSHLSFLYGFVLLWMLAGNGLAVLFSSAGPVYYERLGLGTDFAPLMAYLNEASQVYPVWALRVQEELWNSYAHGDGAFSGISAMPSLHVASAVLFLLYGFQLHQALGWALSLFALLIMIGSVHLGWHYAVDGYAGAVVALGCWWAGKRLAGCRLHRAMRPG